MMMAHVTMTVHAHAATAATTSPFRHSGRAYAYRSNSDQYDENFTTHCTHSLNSTQLRSTTALPITLQLVKSAKGGPRLQSSLAFGFLTFTVSRGPSMG
jgi:hypothetical protein